MQTEQQASTRHLFKSMLQGSGLYSLALLAPRLSGLILLPINTRFLTPADYGVLELLEQIGLVLAVLLGLNFSAALGFFYFEQTSSEARQRVVSTTVVGSVLIGMLAGIGGLLVATPISKYVFLNVQYRPYLIFVLAALPLTFLLEATFSWLRIEDRALQFTIASLARLGLTIIGTIVLVAVLRLHVWGVLFTSVGAITTMAVVLTIYCYRQIAFSFDRKLFRQILGYSVPLGLSGAAMFVIHFGDRFVLPHYRPMSDLGIYAIAYKIGMVMSLVYSSFHTYWSAQIFKIAKRPDADAIGGRVFTYVIGVLSFCALGIIVAARPALRELTAPSFHSAAGLVPIIVGAYFIRSIGDFVRCRFLVVKRPEFDAACNWIGAVVCGAGYMLLIPPYGMWGAAIATAIAFVVIAVVSLVWTYRLNPYYVEWPRVLKLVVAAGAPLAAYYAVPVESLAGQMVWAVFLTLCFPVLLVLLRLPTPGEWEVLRSGVERIRAMTSRRAVKSAGR